MAIRIEERFQVNRPVEPVWEWLVDPRQVVTCLPGAALQEVVDERTFHGSVQVKVGAVTVSYRGTVRIVELDAAARRVKMTGEGRESAGAGSAKMTMESSVTSSPSGGSEILVRADVDVVGRIVQLGRGMIEQVAHQLFLQFAACVRARLEAGAAARAAEGAPASPATPPAAGAVPERSASSAGVSSPPGQPPAPAPEAVRALPLLMRALWAWLLSLFRGGARGGRRA